MNRLFAFALVTILFTTSCSKLKEVDVRDMKVKRFELINTTTANIHIEYLIENPSGRTITVQSADGILKKRGVNFAYATLLSADVVTPKMASINNIVFRIEINDPLSLLSMGLNVSRWDLDEFFLDGIFTLKVSGAGRKTLKYKNVPLKNIVNAL
ncbi:MAG: hypothetical protein A2X19_08860 [Bacteroidetes bacterium GWE2_39_28]|nr:MAG: hypothetical protein A2X19_08860 [Bacteroidetes bacterium GWE2_39_28]OFY12179.1 MAG: hypothetical protein A2X16_06435 [Bacteroidetes bacterium GWF2_39_10]OFZ08948.1 MAG: hypothetical protein A2322_01685 [Bacteroidetes bacterium RIFOXYB2_FULL_39_7]OFZ12343.1 MAG: hypothetical protein A2465_10845 [Bacteroidetes bacterium RIFOXYC2_FULL_39_11]HCT94209.1 hypothetical protein [Rikenellaceae bacterium]